MKSEDSIAIAGMAWIGHMNSRLEVESQAPGFPAVVLGEL